MTLRSCALVVSERFQNRDKFAHGENGCLWKCVAKGRQNIFLERPEGFVTFELGLGVLGDGDVDDGAGRCAWREQQRRKLNQMGTFAEENLWSSGSFSDGGERQSESTYGHASI